MHLAAPEEREHRLGRVARLFFHHREVDAVAVKPRRGTGFQAPYGQLHLPQACREGDGCRIARTARLVALQADVDQSSEEGTGGENHGPCTKAQADLGYNP